MQTNSTLATAVTPSTPSIGGGASLAGAQLVPPSGIGGYSSSTRLRGIVNTKRQRLTGKQIAQRVQKQWLSDVKRLDVDKLKALAEALPPMHPTWGADAAASGSMLHEGVAKLKSAVQSVDDTLGRMLTLPGAAATSADGGSCAVDDTDCVEDEPRLGVALFVNKHKSRFGFEHAAMPHTETLGGKIVVIADIHTNENYQKKVVRMLKDARAGDEFWGETPPEFISSHTLCGDLLKRGVVCKGVDLPDARLLSVDGKMLSELKACLEILDPAMAEETAARLASGLISGSVYTQNLKNVVEGATEKQLAALGAKRREEFVSLRDAARKSSSKLDQLISSARMKRDDNFIQLITKALAAKQSSKKTVWFLVGLKHALAIRGKFIKHPRIVLAGPLDESEVV